MRKHYTNLLEKEIDRLWIGKMNVLVIAQGKDKFALSDGRNFAYAKGHQFVKALKKLPDRAGVGRFWKAVEPFKK